ncbi:MAG: hypothetical protein NXI01_02180 [Gammaproteobacteria bacterium]|nr:hypothetical protein [Gammaproteobacteria bacterium]
MSKGDQMLAKYGSIENGSYQQGFFRPDVLDSNFLPSQQHAQIRQQAMCGIFGGTGLITLTACLTFFAGVSIPPVGIALLITIGAMMLGYGSYSMERYRVFAIAHNDYTEDVQPVDEPIETCMDRLYRVCDLT